MHGEPITWHVQTHEHRERTTDWYWALGLSAIVGAAISIYFSNILLALIIILGALCLGVLAVRGPREHQMRVDGRGITVDGTLYRYPTIQNFWVSINEPLPERAHEVSPRIWLSFTTRGYVHPHITVPLDSVEHGHAVRDYLLNFLDEEEQHPHFAEHLAELVGL